MSFLSELYSEFSRRYRNILYKQFKWKEETDDQIGE